MKYYHLILLILLSTLKIGYATPMGDFFEQDVRLLPGYRLIPGDLIWVNVPEERRGLSAEISETGTTSLSPFFWEVPTAGLTTTELARDISTKWKGDLVRPQVTVSVYQFRPKDIISIGVLGEERFNAQAKVDNTGILPHPYLGDLPVIGLTKGGLEQLVAAQLRAANWVASPQVTVAYLSKVGEVVTPPEGCRQFGASLVCPQVRLTGTYDSNVLTTPSNEKSSFVTTLAPSLRLQTGKVHTYALTLGLPMGFYASSSSDDYVDGQARGEANWQLSHALGAKLYGEYLKGHDARGSTDRPDTGEPNTWHTLGIGGGLSYGRREASGRLELATSYINRRYDTFGLTDKLDDRDVMNLSSTFFYQIFPKTYLLFEAQYQNTDYVSSTSNMDNDEMRYSVGATWEATAKTNANMRVGYLNRNYKATGVQDFSGLNWDAGIHWKPASNSQLDLTTNQSVDDASGVGDHISTKNYGLAWKQEWLPRLSSTLSASLSNQDFTGSPRSDDLYNYGVNFNYQLSKNLVGRSIISLGAGVQMTNRDSSMKQYDYDRSLYSLTLQASF